MYADNLSAILFQKSNLRESASICVEIYASISAFALFCSGLLPSQKVADLCSKVRFAFRRLLAAVFLLSINLRVAQQIILNELPAFRGVFAHVE